MHADCYTLLDGWPSNAALVTDPPYGIGYKHGGGGLSGGLQGSLRVKPKHHGKTKTIHGDTTAFDPAPFLRFAVVCLFGADHFRARLPEGGTILAWDKSCGMGPDDDFTDGEFAWTNRAGIKRNVFRHLWKGLVCKKTGEGLNNPNQFRRLHTSQKPVALMAWCLDVCGVRTGLVIDPFMGSGSLGIACHRAGLQYLGVEIDPEHYAVARERLVRLCV